MVFEFSGMTTAFFRCDFEHQPGHPPMLKILYLEDSEVDVLLLKRALAQENLQAEVQSVSSSGDYKTVVAKAQFDVILSDAGLPVLADSKPWKLHGESARTFLSFSCQAALMKQELKRPWRPVEPITY